MRWSFHKRRDHRYQIALDELKKTFSENGGGDIATVVQELPSSKNSKNHKKLLREFYEIQNCFESRGVNYKKKHYHFLKSLRKSLNILDTIELKESWHHSINRLIHELCKTKFYRVHLFLFGHHLLQDLFASLIRKQNANKLDFDKHFSQYSFLDESHLILASQPAIFLERDIRKFNESVTQAIFDPHKYNHPFLLYTLALFRRGKLCRVKMVRMGSPTREIWGKTPLVIEEFKGFLKVLKEENKTHCYINKQRTWGKEGQRSFAIKSLEQKFDNFFCICLPSDGAFYYQQMSYATQKKAKGFKEVFYKLLIGEVGQGYYHFPENWLENKDFCLGLKKVIGLVHTLYFDQKDELSVAERRHFIDHVYTQIIIFCLQQFPINSINITCRDGIDRAGCEQIKLLYFYQISLGIQEEVESKIERQFLMHIPPYLAKNRPIVKERREYLYQLLQSTYNAEVCNRIHNQGKLEPLLYIKPHFVKRSV